MGRHIKGIPISISNITLLCLLGYTGYIQDGMWASFSHYLKKLFWTQKWIPTYGYKRAKAQEQREWLIEAKEGDNPNHDPFAKVKKGKIERQSKNELQRLRNIARSKNIKLPKVGLPTKEHFHNSRQLSEAANVARKSTASLGKFHSWVCRRASLYSTFVLQSYSSLLHDSFSFRAIKLERFHSVQVPKADAVINCNFNISLSPYTFFIIL